MADPTIQTFCCHNGRYNTDLSVRMLNEFNSFSYNIVCVCSSVIGILGAIYQIYPKKISTSSNTRGKQIIMWLAVADLLASLGVFVRSLVWMHFNKLIDVDSDTSNVVFCALTAAWTQYFYTATWCWTLCYAIDTYQFMKERDSYTIRYHICAWGFPALSTGIGLYMLYYPRAECHDMNSLGAALKHVLPNYIATYLPIAVVMIANPILYYLSSKDIVIVVFRPLNQITNKERFIAQNIKFKFCLINVVFICCWLPNLINGILLWTLWFNLPTKIIIGFWYFMAVMNPLQALFNALIYRRWFPICCLNNKKGSEPTVRTPLLRPEPPSRLHLSSNSRLNSINLSSSI
ncbi:G-protein coupled receptor 143-like isoform X2 [Arctopsyche grandis]